MNNTLKGFPEDLQGDFCVIREFALRQSLAEKTAAILAEAPRILGLSVSIWNHAATLELLLELETVWGNRKAEGAPPQPVIVLGGPELTGLPPETTLFRHADFVILGEGEACFPELCRALLTDPSEARKRYGTFINVPPVSLASIKTGYYLYNEEDLRRKLIYVETSRGCPYSCAFCQSAVKIPHAPPVREFLLEELLSDLDRLIRRLAECAELSGSGGTPRTLKVLDRSFNINLPRTLEILEFCLKKIETAGVPLQFHFEMIPAAFPEELRAVLRRFPPGSLRLEIGIQSLNRLTCALVHRTSSPEGELEVLRFLRRETAAIVHADLIAGLPGEDLASFGEGFDQLWLALTDTALTEAGLTTGGPGGDDPPPADIPFEIQPGIFKCLPGTPIRLLADKAGLKYNKAAPYEVIETKALPASGMEMIKNYARFWELLVNRRPFPELLPALAPPGKPVFRRFMDTSQKLLVTAGRNWGIPRDELREMCLRITKE